MLTIDDSQNLPPGTITDRIEVRGGEIKLT